MLIFVETGRLHQKATEKTQGTTNRLFLKLRYHRHLSYSRHLSHLSHPRYSLKKEKSVIIFC